MENVLESTTANRKREGVLRRYGLTFAIVGLGLLLYVPGVNWGLPAVVSWSQDTIAGVRTLGAMETWPHRWMGRYPPLHYMVLSAVYEPVLAHWRASGQLQIDPQTGREQMSPPHAPKIGLLLLVAGVVSVAMAIGTGLVLMRAGREATDDPLGGLLAAIFFMSGAAFTYFAHLGNVDVPSMFWFSLSLLFYIRAWKSRGTLDAGLLGLFAALTVSTKDGWAGIYPGMALVLLASQWRHMLREGRPAAAALVHSLFQPRWLIGLFFFALPFLLINGIFWNPRAYANRLGGWLSPATSDWVSHEMRLGPLRLAWETLLQTVTAVGWPMLVVLIAAIIFTLIRRTQLVIILLVPALSYYLIVIERMDFVYERFLFAPIMLLSILTGFAAATFLRARSIAVFLRVAVLVVVMLPTAGYAVAVDLEMIYDTRYAAEDWFVQNVPRETSVGAITGSSRRFSPQYQPRLHELGYPTFPVVCQFEEFGRDQPEYLVLSGFDLQDFDQPARVCASKLESGELGYRPVIRFHRRSFLDTEAFWYRVAAFGAPAPGKISPHLTIFHRD